MNNIVKIEIIFQCAVDFPDGFEQALDSMVNMVCEKYQRENPTMVMWTAGQGLKPLWNEPHEPEFDESIYQIEVAAREDFAGNNPHNPDRERLREETRKRKQAIKAPERFA